ncbi:MAG TPA: ATP-binding protein [Polyangia bacterium]|nr:ATP-binding protein [Polyangia bacterium]
MAKHRAIRHRLLTVVLLGVLTSALSLLALVRAVASMSQTLRIDRAREAVGEELDRLADGEPGAAALAGPPRTTYIGLRGGWLARPDDAQEETALPAEWRAALEQAARRAVAAHGRVITETVLGSGTLLLAVQPGRTGTPVWTGYLVQPSAYFQPWRWIAATLAAATVLLVAIAVWVTLSLRRSTASLHATLVALGKDLTTPVPRPRIAELTGIADGIRGLAAELLASREATERLSRELAQQERLAALGRVAAGIAHEVRNPLASIKLRLDLTATAHELPEPARRAVEAASHEIARLDRLVSDLLLVAGKKMGPRRRVDLGALVRARVEEIHPWAATQEVMVRVTVEGGGGKKRGGEAAVDVDAESLARAIDNLLRNAVEASPAGGIVEARVATMAEGVELRVEDQGRGIEPARTSELFEPFFTTKAEGTGLGLAISRAIARAHGGEVVYARAEGVTRFSLLLPRPAQEEMAA